MAIYKLIFLKQVSVWSYEGSNVLFKKDERDLGEMHVRENGGRKNSDSLVFNKSVSLYANIESMQWRNLGLLETLVLLKSKVISLFSNKIHIQCFHTSLIITL